MLSGVLVSTGWVGARAAVAALSVAVVVGIGHLFLWALVAYYQHIPPYVPPQ
jgi:hypothetical protein